MTITVPAGTAAGAYPITVTGISGSLSHSATVNVNVQAAQLSVAVKTDKSSYNRGQTVSVTRAHKCSLIHFRSYFSNEAFFVL